MGAATRNGIPSLLQHQSMERPMKRNDLSRSLVAFEQNSTLVAVVELSLKSWLVAGLVPGLARQPMKRIGADEKALLALVERWQGEATKAGSKIGRIAVAFEAGRDGFWLARWLRARGIEAYVIHPNSVPVSREHRRAKSDRLDTALLMRAFLGWLRGEAKHCSMAAIPTLAEEDARRPNREHEHLVGERTSILNRLKGAMVRLGLRNFNIKLRKASEQLEQLRTPEGEPLPPNTLTELRRDLARLRLVREQIEAIEKQRLERLRRAPQEGAHPLVLLLARLLGLGVETADMLVHEVLSRNLRDERAVGRYAGITGSPDESGSKRREKGLAKAGNGRVRRGMIQLAWRWLMFQKESALAKWFAARTAHAPRDVRKTMIVALARKLLIALWRYVTTGEVPAGAKLRPVI
jgi:transposase